VRERSAPAVQQALGAVGLGNVSNIQVVRADGAAAGGGDPTLQLERLADLHERGVLTDADFDRQKRRILGEE
jgi:Short C-terminal domain